MKKFVTASLTTLLLIAAPLSAVAAKTSPQTAAAQNIRHVNEVLRNFATNACLAADFQNIYNYNCSVSNQKWGTINLKSNGDFRLKNFATSQCLANLDYNRVYMTSCSSTEPGIWWHADPASGLNSPNSFIINTHINRYLSTDYSTNVYLADKTHNQYWRWEPPTYSSPLDCFAEFDGNDNYFIDGWVNARVADINGVFLGCGDERSGIIHIGHPESTGNVHPITAQNQGYFLTCFQTIALRGTSRPDSGFPQTRTKRTFTYNGGVASFIFDNSGRFVWSMFTSTALDLDGADWYGCQAGSA